jgi:hypothetical protein
MTLYLTNIKGTIEEMEDLFDNSTTISVRHYCPSKVDSDNFDIIVRCNEEQEPKIKRKRTLKGIINALK